MQLEKQDVVRGGPICWNTTSSSSSSSTITSPARRKFRSLGEIGDVSDEMRASLGRWQAGAKEQSREQQSRAQLEEQLEEQTGLAKSAEMMLAYMTHEIRNLLFGQQANLDLVADLLAKLERRLAYNSSEDERLQRKDDVKACSDARQLLADACNCSSSIVRVVNDTLDAKRASQFEFLATESEPCLVEAIIGQCAKTVAHKLESKPLTLEVVPHKAEEVEVEETIEDIRKARRSFMDTPRPPSKQYYMGDADRVTQVLANLVSNAIKYTDQGKITIASEELSGGLVKYSVTDTGPGCSEDIRPRLFNSAYLQSTSNSRACKAGTGLGLFLCRAIVVDSLGGTIDYEKHPGHGGSVFSFVIPMPRCPAPPTKVARFKNDAEGRPLVGRRHTSGDQPRPSLPPRRHTAGGDLGCASDDDGSADDDSSICRRLSSCSDSFCEEPGPLLLGRRILVVDDSKINRAVISRALTSAGATVDLAEDGVVALEMLQTQPCCLLWTDIEMPKMGGIELVRELRRLPGYEKTPAVAFTGSVTAKNEAEYLAAGCTAVVQKPCRPAHIVDHVLRHLEEADAYYSLQRRRDDAPAMPLLIRAGRDPCGKLGVVIAAAFAKMTCKYRMSLARKASNRIKPV